MSCQYETGTVRLLTQRFVSVQCPAPASFIVLAECRHGHLAVEQFCTYHMEALEAVTWGCREPDCHGLADMEFAPLEGNMARGCCGSENTRLCTCDVTCGCHCPDCRCHA